MAILLQAPNFWTYVPWAALFGLITYLFGWWRFKPKDKAQVRLTGAETADKLVATAGALVDRLNRQCEEFAKELQEGRELLEEKQRLLENIEQRLKEKERQFQECATIVNELRAKLDELTGPDRRREPNR
jgi:lipopolysaccharide biosynthesis regulator YciM